MTTTVSSRLVLSDIIQLTSVQTHLQGNFAVIGQQLDRLFSMHEDLSKKLNMRIDQLQDRLSMGFSMEQQDEKQTEKEIEETQIVTPETKIEVCQKVIKEFQPEAPKRLSVQRQRREASPKSRAFDANNELQKQISRLNHQLQVERSRIDELQKDLARRQRQQVKTNKKLQSENEPLLNRQFSNAQLKNPTDEKRLQMITSKLENDMSTMQLQLNLIQKQLKQAALKKESISKPPTEATASKLQKVEETKEEQVKEEIIVENTDNDGQQQPPKPTLEGMKELLDDLAFKVNRLDAESIKVFKHINALNSDRQRHEDELVSIVQKIKKNETTVADEMKELQQRIDLLMTKKTLRQEKLLAARDDTNSSVLATDIEQESIINGKRLEEIMMELEDLKDEITDIRAKEELRRQAEQSKDPNCSVTSAVAGPPPSKSNYTTLESAIGSVRRDINSLRYELEMLKSKEEINQQLSAECQGKSILPIRQSDAREHWKEMSIKLQRVRSELLGYIKELDLKLNERDEGAEQLREVESLANETKILLAKKADRTDTEKALKKLETRLNNFIKQSIEQEELASTHDARIAKQPWFCLSCDTQLKNYSGKQGKHLSKDLAPIKKLNSKDCISLAESHMVRRPVRDLEAK